MQVVFILTSRGRLDVLKLLGRKKPPHQPSVCGNARRTGLSQFHPR